MNGLYISSPLKSVTSSNKPLILVSSSSSSKHSSVSILTLFGKAGRSGIYPSQMSWANAWSTVIVALRNCPYVCFCVTKKLHRDNPHFVENRDWYLASHSSYKITNDILTNCRLLFFMTNTYVSFSCYKITKLQTKNRTGKICCYGRRPSSFGILQTLSKISLCRLQSIKSNFSKSFFPNDDTDHSTKHTTRTSEVRHPKF